MKILKIFEEISDCLILFSKIVAWAKNNNIRGVGDCDTFGRKAIDVELLILATLTILGRSVCLEIASQLTGISIEVIRNFFHIFCNKFSKDFFDKDCSFPSEPEDIQCILEGYNRLGLPGCIGSTDCVHIPWTV